MAMKQGDCSEGTTVEALKAKILAVSTNYLPMETRTQFFSLCGHNQMISSLSDMRKSPLCIFALPGESGPLQ